MTDEAEVFDIVEMIKEREFGYSLSTNYILSLISEKLTLAAQAYLKTNREITWYAIDIHPILAGFCTMKAFVQTKPGDVLIVSGKQVVVDEENISKYKNAFNVSIPQKTLQTGSVDDIFNTMHNIFNIIQNMDEEDAFKLLSDPNLDLASRVHDILDNPERMALIEQITRPKMAYDFTVTDLTEDQLRQLNHFHDTYTANGVKH